MGSSQLPPELDEEQRLGSELGWREECKVAWLPNHMDPVRKGRPTERTPLVYSQAGHFRLKSTTNKTWCPEVQRPLEV